jgi:hypothetical protein
MVAGLPSGSLEYLLQLVVRCRSGNLQSSIELSVGCRPFPLFYKKTGCESYEDAAPETSYSVGN